MVARAVHGVGLGGDGDEIAAIRDVEEAFGVRLDYSDARTWHTAGDVFAALRRALPAAEDNGPEVWNRFAKALSGETGVDPAEIEPNSPLLSRSRMWVHVANASATLWGGVAITALITIGWMIL